MFICNHLSRQAYVPVTIIVIKWRDYDIIAFRFQYRSRSKKKIVRNNVVEKLLGQTHNRSEWSSCSDMPDTFRKTVSTTKEIAFLRNNASIL